MIVSVVCPCRNEIGNIDTFLCGLAHQQADDFELEVIVADGESTDGTSEALAAWRARGPGRVVISNPSRIVSTGLNAAIRIARGEVIIRMDVHTQYAEDYVAQCVRALKQTGATCVGGAWLAKGHSLRQRAIAAGFGSPFGSGGAKSRRPDYNGAVDTVYLGAWRRADLIALSGFDESLIRNQDDELCLRITRSGGRLWQSSSIRSHYLPRDTFGALWQQFYEYGYWKAAVIRKHRRFASLRQLAPTSTVVLLFALVIAGFFVPDAWLLLAGALIAYVAAAFLAAVLAIRSHRPTNLISVVVSFVCMHLGYGLGLGRGILNFFIFGRRHGGGAAAFLGNSDLSSR
jgi:glycosyltransferase involved in cell wall biosynthesis